MYLINKDGGIFFESGNILDLNYASWEEYDF